MDPPAPSDQDNKSSPLPEDGQPDGKSVRRRTKKEFPKLAGGKDVFCWACHRSGRLATCSRCPRAFHFKCAHLDEARDCPPKWVCPECESIRRAKSAASSSLAYVEKLSKMLCFVLDRLKQIQGSDNFSGPVDVNNWPDYLDYIVMPMDLPKLETNIKNQMYTTTEEFLADFRWIVHDSYIYNSVHSVYTKIAKSMLGVAKQECEEIKNCSGCYFHAYSLKLDWFVEPCATPHILVWAQLSGFPYWPGKVMKCLNGMVDVRFFGDHSRANVPVGSCFLYSRILPVATKKLNPKMDNSIEEAEQCVEKLIALYGSFYYAQYRVPFMPKEEDLMRKLQLPGFTCPKETVEFIAHVEVVREKNMIENDDEFQAQMREIHIHQKVGPKRKPRNSEGLLNKRVVVPFGSHGAKCAIVTLTGQESYKRLQTHEGSFCEEVAAKRLKLNSNPEEVLVIEDSPESKNASVVGDPIATLDNSAASVLKTPRRRTKGRDARLPRSENTKRLRSSIWSNLSCTTPESLESNGDVPSRPDESNNPIENSRIVCSNDEPVVAPVEQNESVAGAEVAEDVPVEPVKNVPVEPVKNVPVEPVKNVPVEQVKNVQNNVKEAEPKVVEESIREGIPAEEVEVHPKPIETLDKDLLSPSVTITKLIKKCKPPLKTVPDVKQQNSIPPESPSTPKTSQVPLEVDQGNSENVVQSIAPRRSYGQLLAELEKESSPVRPPADVSPPGSIGTIASTMSLQDEGLTPTRNPSPLPRVAKGMPIPMIEPKKEPVDEDEGPIELPPMKMPTIKVVDTRKLMEKQPTPEPPPREVSTPQNNMIPPFQPKNSFNDLRNLIEHQSSALGTKFKENVLSLMSEVESEYESYIEQLTSVADGYLRQVESNFETNKQKLYVDFTAKVKSEMAEKISEIKRKQWCANCSSEAVFHCCWNYGYCGEQCQKEHWAEHNLVCTQYSMSAKDPYIRASPRFKALLEQGSTKKILVQDLVQSPVGITVQNSPPKPPAPKKPLAFTKTLPDGRELQRVSLPAPRQNRFVAIAAGSSSAQPTANGSRAAPKPPSSVKLSSLQLSRAQPPTNVYPGPFQTISSGNSLQVTPSLSIVRQSTEQKKNGSAAGPKRSLQTYGSIRTLQPAKPDLTIQRRVVPSGSQPTQQRQPAQQQLSQRQPTQQRQPAQRAPAQQQPQQSSAPLPTFRVMEPVELEKILSKNHLNNPRYRRGYI